MADIVNDYRSREFLIKNLPHGRGDYIYQFLEYLSWDIAKWEDDFLGDTLHGSYQSTASGAASAAAAIDTGKVNGQILLDCGTADDGRSDLSLGLHYRGDQNPVFVARLTADNITTLKVEAGFTDVISGTDAGAVNVKATPTFTATDCALWCLDTDDNAYWEGIAVKNATAATTQEAAISPTAATMEYLVVSLRDSAAIYSRYDAAGKRTFEPVVQAAAITSTVLLTPWIFAQNRSAAQHIVSVDYLAAWQRRTT